MQKMQEHFSALHCPNTRHPWRNVKSAFAPSLALEPPPESFHLPGRWPGLHERYDVTIDQSVEL